MPAETEAKTIIGTSVLNLLDSSSLSRGLRSVLTPFDQLLTIANESGYQGLEMHPMRTLAGLQLECGWVTQAQKDAVLSVHQSFRSERGIAGAWRHPNRILAVKSLAVFPHRLDSITNMQRIQKVVGRSLSATLYPALPGEHEPTYRYFRERLFQPTPEVMKKWGVRTAEQLVRSMHQLSFSGLTLDLYHLRQLGNPSLLPWQETLPQLLKYTKEVQVSAGRTDMATLVESNVDTMGEVKALLTGDNAVEIVRMLEFIGKSGWKGLVITEIPDFAIRAQVGGTRFGRAELVAAHRDITQTISGALAVK